MTRETKVGMVVATSFLGLVGVVVAARMARTDDSARHDAGVTAAINPIVHTAEPSSATSSPEPQPAKPKQDSAKTPTGLVPVTSIPNSPEPPPLQVPDQATQLLPLPKDPPKAAPAPMDINDVLDEQRKKSIAAPGATAALDPLPGFEAKGLGTPPPPISVPPKGSDLIPPAAPVSPPSNTEPLPTPPAGKPGEPLIASPASKPLDPVVAGPKPADPLNVPPVPSNLSSTPVAAALAGNSGSNGPTPKVEPKSQGAPPPVEDFKPVVPGQSAPAGTGDPPAPVALNNTGPDSPPAAIPTEAGRETKPLSPSPATAIDPVPKAPVPVGAIPSAVSPPISVAVTPGSKVQVESYDVETYVVKADDHSYADISQRVYGTDKYARALMLYNRNYYGAAEALRQDPPQIQAGLAIHVPPTKVLESKYSSTMSEAGAGMNSRPSPPVTLAPPSPLSSSPGNPSALAGPPPGTRLPPTIGTNPDNTRNYTVRENGEHILEITRTVFGSAQRWQEVYNLNRDKVNPAYPIPGGTVLKLPAS